MPPATNTHLTDAQLADLERRLTRQLERVTRSIDGLDITAASIMDAKSDEDAMGQIEAVENQRMLSTLAERDRIRIVQITDALKRLRDGAYGFCTSCKSAIAFERLDVMPEAAACRACA